MLPTPQLKGRIEHQHRFRDGRPEGVREIHLEVHQPPALQTLYVAELGAVAVWERKGVVLRHAHLVDILAIPMRVKAGPTAGCQNTTDDSLSVWDPSSRRGHAARCRRRAGFTQTLTASPRDADAANPKTSLWRQSANSRLRCSRWPLPTPPGNEGHGYARRVVISPPRTKAPSPASSIDSQEPMRHGAGREGCGSRWPAVRG